MVNHKINEREIPHEPELYQVSIMESGLCVAAAGRPLLPGPATTPRRGPEGARWQASGAPAVGPGKGSGKLEPFVAFCAELAELIEQDPDIPLVELQAALPAADGVPCSTSGTDALLRRHGYTCKRIHISKGLIAEESPGDRR